MIKTSIALLLVFVSPMVNAQNLFPKKLNNCVTERFCLDCGEIKVNVDNQKLGTMIEQVSATTNLKGVKGKVFFQILVDSVGKGCVLSHNDASESTISKNIITALNSFDGFIPAKSKEKIEPRTSFNMSFEISNDKMTAKVERVDVEAFRKSFDRPNSPEIYN
jgi:hypothetical protein